MYSKIKRRARHRFKVKEGRDICNSAKSNPKQFWKYVKKKNKNAQNSNINIANFKEHFSELLTHGSGNSDKYPDHIQKYMMSIWTVLFQRKK